METFTHSEKLMGNMFTFSMVTASEAAFKELVAAAVAEVKRIEKILTTYSETSETAQINAQAGIAAVCVSDETFDLIQRSLFLSEITQGAFDITYGGIDKSLWNFDRTMTSLPSPEKALQSVHLVNYKNVILNESEKTVFLKEKGMRLGFGGIGKGFAAEKVKLVLQKAGVTDGIVNASGDLCAWGTQPNGNPWTVGIAHPDLRDAPFSYLSISNRAIATSGTYEKFITINGKRYSHTINPKTGLPVQGIKSVTIIAPNAELADALATPVSVMGIKSGLYLIEQIPEVHAIVIDDQNNLFKTSQIQLK
ncbi:FAD:protein FMN transferase [Flavobacterium aurantiibacter]|uniref:FAD:protein FMN transferase n=1 Tax=Flavobacterium aurantiibacter TaxID=2023067 RepID=A0A255ZGU6_9FLAO|nr:FAD:protein FMN transferase [Flavobacterium aurantiibacter]OYQ40651.1 thiamine biosynthesis protein ApbE [Flavobacterium aurantiibacter]